MWIWILAIAAAGALILQGCSSRGQAIPRRLESRAPIERQGYKLFPFDRIASGFQYMGSSTPIRERLVIATWTPASHDEARREAILEVQDRVRKIAWRDAGTGEGIHEVNTNSNPAWVIVEEDTARGWTAAYMAWKKDTSDDPAKVHKDVAKMLAGFVVPAMPGRPNRLEAAEETLAKHGVTLKLDAGPVRAADGAICELFTSKRLDSKRVVAVLVPVGELPARQAYRHLRPATPRNIGNWSDLQWFSREFGQGAFDGMLDLTERLVAMAASEVSPGHAKFYAARVEIIDDPDAPVQDFEFLWKVQPAMSELFRNNKLVMEDAR